MLKAIEDVHERQNMGGQLDTRMPDARPETHDEFLDFILQEDVETDDVNICAMNNQQ